jgi:hypothetical protein
MGSTFEDFKASSVAVKKDLDLDNLKDILFSVFETTQKKGNKPSDTLQTSTVDTCRGGKGVEAAG